MTEQQTPDQVDLTIGQYLSREREKKKLTVKTISQHTKISTTKLELIESDNFDELPSLAYVTGFVKSYAKTLHLDQDFCLELLDKAYGIKKEPIPEEHLEKLSDTDKPSIESFNGLPLGKIVGAVASVTVIIGILVFVGQDRTQSEPVKKITPKSVDSDTPLAESRPPVEETAQATEEETEPEEQGPQENTTSEEEANNENEIVNESQNEDSENGPTGLTEMDVNIRPFPGPTFNWDTQMTQAQINELIPEQRRVSAQQGEHFVYINASEGETWITYKSDDKQIRRITLREGQDILLRGNTHRLFLGNINATQIFINNRPIEVQSRTGVKSLVVPREAHENYSLPLFIYPETGGVLTSDEYLETIKELD